MQIAETKNAFLLHSRKFSDSQVILRFLTETDGLVSAIFRVPAKRASPPRPFVPVAINWAGRSELKSLRLYEEDGSAFPLKGRTLFCGLYINELLCRVLQAEEPCRKMFEDYASVMAQLSLAANQNELQEVLLRRFEFQLLAAQGLGLDFQVDSKGEAISASSDGRYEFQVSNGFVRQQEPSDFGFTAQSLHDIAHGVWNKESLNTAKRICRAALKPLLGDAPIKSRELFQ